MSGHPFFKKIGNVSSGITKKNGPIPLYTPIRKQMRMRCTLFRDFGAGFLKVCLLSIFGHVNAQTDSLKLPLLPVSRALPSPLKSPPFPGADWLCGPIIGEPADAPDYALQKFLGLANDKSCVKVYGWVNPSYTFSSSKSSNIPVSYNIIPNSFQLD